VTPTRWGMTVPFAGVPLARHADLYRRVEALGYDDLWSSETPNGTDGFTTLALAAPVTERMRLATGIVNPFTRGPAVLAQTAAALQEASEGRFVLGLGSSSDVVVERFNDGTFVKPVSKVREAVQRLRPVLTAPPQKGLGGLRLERPVTDTVPIVLAALRPRMLALAGELADGAFTNFLPLSGTELVAAAHRDAAMAAGRDPGELVCRFMVLPGDEGEDLARMMFVNYGSVPVYTEFFRWLGWGERLDPMVEAYRAGDRKRALELAPDELISEVYVTGSTEQIHERLSEFVARGITTVVLAPFCAPEQLPEVLEALAPR
jgi:probable F420-dependent oxidoreductase